MIKIITFRPEEKYEPIKIKGTKIDNVPITKIIKLKIDPNSFLNEKFDYVIFTSTLGIKYFKEEIKDYGEFLMNKKVIAIGQKTADYFGIDCIIPEEQSSRGIMNIVEKDSRILLIRSSNGNPYLVKKLKEIGKLKVINVYKSVVIDSDYSDVYRKLSKMYYDAVIFTSSFIFRSYIKIFSRYGDPLKIIPEINIAIGKRTANTMKKFNIKPYVMEIPDVKKSVEKIIEIYNSKIR